MTTVAERIKPDNIRHDRHVSLCVEDEYHYVTLEGVAQLDEDPERARQTVELLVNRYVDEEERSEWVERLMGEGRRITLWISPKAIHKQL